MNMHRYPLLKMHRHVLYKWGNPKATKKTFAEKIAEGHAATEACYLAGYRPPNGNSPSGSIPPRSRQLRHPPLMKLISKPHSVTVNPSSSLGPRALGGRSALLVKELGCVFDWL